MRLYSNFPLYCVSMWVTLLPLTLITLIFVLTQIFSFSSLRFFSFLLTPSSFLPCFSLPLPPKKTSPSLPPQGHLRRAQHFLSLCVGDKGPSYRKSLVHSVLRRSGAGEGLVGGDYERKAGKGGAAILAGMDDEEGVAKRCERGMVSIGWG